LRLDGQTTEASRYTWATKGPHSAEWDESDRKPTENGEDRIPRRVRCAEAANRLVHRCTSHEHSERKAGICDWRGKHKRLHACSMH
jgi:hypothetical protein